MPIHTESIIFIVYHQYTFHLHSADTEESTHINVIDDMYEIPNIYI